MSQPAALANEPASRLKRTGRKSTRFAATPACCLTAARRAFRSPPRSPRRPKPSSNASSTRRSTRLSESQRAFVSKNVALVAVGGTGRGELCPYSDVDLLFLIRPVAKQAAGDCISQAVRDYWDAGLRLGHAVRGISDTLSLARQEIDVATALVEARLVWGDPGLFDQLFAEFQRKIIRARAAAFIDDCVESRERERAEFGSAVKQLEPDVKRSPGGLRDLHLMRWVGFARFAVAGVDSLRLLGALSRDEARCAVDRI